MCFQHPTGENIPLELFYEIVLNLEPKSLLKLCQSSSTIHRFCQDQSEKAINLWQLKLQKDFPSANLAKLSNTTIQRFYFEHAFPKQIKVYTDSYYRITIPFTPSDNPHSLAEKIMNITQIRARQYFEFFDTERKKILTLMYPNDTINRIGNKSLSDLRFIVVSISRSNRRYKDWTTSSQ